MTLNEDKIRTIIKVLRKEIGLLLAGFDVVIDNVTGNHAVIDINVYPSYDNFPNFFENLLNCIDEMVNISSMGNGEFNEDDFIGFREDILDRHTMNGLINVAMDVNKGIRGMNIN